jgi:DNA-binding transcriptional LysR family regulator
MELRQLRYLEAIVRHQHFTRAADELHVAQSALSHQIQGLERELGIELLQRTTRSVAPTEAGALVAARARSVMAEIDALRAEVDELRGLVRGHVAVGAMLFGGEVDIPGVLSQFITRYPGVELSLREGSAQRMIEMLHNGSLDLTFALELTPPEGVERHVLSNEELALATSPEHPLAGTRRLRIQALDGQPLIGFHSGSSSREILDRALAAAGVRPRIALEANDFALVRALVAQGVGLAVLPQSYLARVGPEIAFRPLDPPLRMDVVLWWRSGRTLSPAARAFVEFAAEAAAAARPKRPAPRPRAARRPARPGRPRATGSATAARSARPGPRRS